MADVDGIVLLGDAELGGSREGRGVHHDDAVVVLGGLDAGGVAQRVDVHTAGAQRRHLDQPEIDQATPHAAAALVHDAGQRVEHVRRIADVDGETGAHEFLDL